MTSESSNQHWLNRNILAMGVTSLFSDFGHEMATAVLPVFLVSLGGSAALLGVIEGVADASISAMKLFSGWYSDYVGKRKPFAVVGYLLTAAGIGSLTFATSWTGILGSRVVAWLGRGTREPARDALLADSSDRRYYGRVFGFHRGMDTLGAILGPASAFFLIKAIPVRSIFMVALIPSVVAFCVITFMVRETRRAPGERVERLRSIRLLPSRFRMFLIAVGVFGFGNFAPTLLILRTTSLLSPLEGAVVAGSVAILAYTVHNICYATLSFPIGALADRFGKRMLLVCGYMLAGTASIGFMFNVASPLYLGLCFGLAGSAMAFIDALERIIAADLLPEQLRGTGYGMLATVNGMGDFGSSTMVGLLWSAVSPLVSFGYGGMVMAIGGLLLIFLPTE